MPLEVSDRIIGAHPSPDNQVFQDWIFLIDGHEELLQINNGHSKAKATDAIALLESKD